MSMFHPELATLEDALNVRCTAQAGSVRLGIDTVEVRQIEASLAAFGERFVQRLFTDHEIETCNHSPAHRPQRLAARFAAKEAAIKAFDLAEVGVDWRHIEVRSDAAGRPQLALHGRAAERAAQWGCGPVTVSLSHDGGHACAVVAAIVAAPGAATVPIPSPERIPS